MPALPGGMGGIMGFHFLVTVHHLSLWENAVVCGFADKFFTGEIAACPL
jgi:hypothetical protein